MLRSPFHLLHKTAPHIHPLADGTTIAAAPATPPAAYADYRRPRICKCAVEAGVDAVAGHAYHLVLRCCQWVLQQTLQQQQMHMCVHVCRQQWCATSAYIPRAGGGKQGAGSSLDACSGSEPSSLPAPHPLLPRRTWLLAALVLPAALCRMRSAEAGTDGTRLMGGTRRCGSGTCTPGVKQQGSRAVQVLLQGDPGGSISNTRKTLASAPANRSGWQRLAERPPPSHQLTDVDTILSHAPVARAMWLLRAASLASISSGMVLTRLQGS